jgi:acyl-coenzyme A synthetase/AMP-(fatty) acid ligase
MLDALPRTATGKLAREGLLAAARAALARERRRA